MIKYCLERGLINKTNITHAIYASLSIKKDHYNDFIEYIYQELGDLAKLAINSMTGCFKPKVRECWKSLLITTDVNNAFYHYLDKRCCYMDERKIGDQQYYQVYEQSFTSREETEAPIYNMILEQEAIQLHKLSKIIEGQGGLVLDLSTDCVSCAFSQQLDAFCS